MPDLPADPDQPSVPDDPETALPDADESDGYETVVPEEILGGDEEE